MRVHIVGCASLEVNQASEIARDAGADIQRFDNFEDALRRVRKGGCPDVLLIDVADDVKAAIEALRAERFTVHVVAYGVDASPQQAAAAVKAGAEDFLPLPPDREAIAGILRALARPVDKVTAADPKMLALLDEAKRFAATDANVFVNGESGVGKEVIARYVHEHSRRSHGPFVSVNCAAIPENLLESELFGHEKGAFTGAAQRRIGKFEEAHGGTLLLDEITEMDIRLQAKLLRAIQEREIDRVGGTKPIPIDIRIVSTSNRDLLKAVDEHVFREDLLFRLNVLTLDVPPLRERPKDVEALARHFVRKFADDAGGEKVLAPSALAAMAKHRWRGNVRELESSVYRAVLLARGPMIEDHDLFPHARRAAASGAEAPPVSSAQAQPEGALSDPFAGCTVAEMERRLILNTVDQTAGNRTRAAELLGISIRTLRNKLNAYAVG